MSLSTVRRALGKAPTAPARAKAQAARKARHKAPAGAPEASVDVDEEAGGIDWSAPPLELARTLLRSVTKQIAHLQPDSPRLNPARTEARNLTRLISRLEQEQAAKETPEDLERRRRREDGDTRKKIEQYVGQALGAALRPTSDAPHGRCPTCAGALSREQREVITGASS